MESVSDVYNDTHCFNFTPKRTSILFIIFCTISFVYGTSLSIQAPFYPKEASGKGLTATQYGLVFAVFEFIIIIVSPLIGKHVKIIGTRFILSASMFLSSASLACFGLLYFISGKWMFFGLSLTVRGIEGIGAAAFYTASFLILAKEFRTSVGTVIATMETVFGIGAIAGPLIGGILFQIGGYLLPFMTVSGLFFVGLILVLSFLRDSSDDNDAIVCKSPKMRSILQIPEIFLACVSVVSSQLALGFVSTNLEPHLRQFNLSPLLIGTIFLADAGAYTLTTPVWGYICDKIENPLHVTLLGNIFIFTASLLIGPASFIPVDTHIWLTIVGLVFQGLGTGSCFVSCFLVGFENCKKNGFPDDLSTYGLVSGLLQSMISIGIVVGSSGGGALYDAVGFRYGSWLVLGCSAISAGCIISHLWKQKRRGISRQDSKVLWPLLSDGITT